MSLALFCAGGRRGGESLCADESCREEVQAIFEPVIQEVVRLVDGQITAVQSKGKQVKVTSL